MAFVTRDLFYFKSHRFNKHQPSTKIYLTTNILVQLHSLCEIHKITDLLLKM
jgi:hypothetical protein